MLKKRLVLFALAMSLGACYVYANVGIVSTSSGYHCTALGAYGTGGCTSGGSYWYYYDGGYPNYEKINIKLNCSNSATDYDMYLYDCGSSYPGTVVASATHTTYPDSVVYQCTSTSRYMLLEVRYYSGATSAEFYLSGVRRPTTKATCSWLNGRNQTLYGYPNTASPQDGIEGYNPYASSEQDHWYEVLVPAWMTNNDSTFRYKIQSSAGNYDLYVYNSNNVLIGTANTSSNPEYTNWMRYKSLPTQYVYLQVRAYNGVNSEYRIDDGGSSVTGVEGDPEPEKQLSIAFSDVYPNPSKGKITLSYQLSNQENMNVKIYNIAGSLIKSSTISNQSAGNHIFNWNGIGNDGNKATPGVYFAEISAGVKMQSKRFVIVK